MRKRIFKILGAVLGIPLLLIIGLIAFLSITEYTPADRQAAEKIIRTDSGTAAEQSLTLYTWNIGYAGLGKESDFFMDGGEMVDPPSQEIVEENLTAIQDFMKNNAADAWLLQEVDVNSARTGHTDQFAQLQNELSANASFAYNYNCPFVPIPLPPIGKVQSGVATMTSLSMKENAERISLFCPFSWPVSTSNLKRCLLVTRTDVANSDKELVLINLHLEAYEDGEGRIAQTKQLIELIQSEYEKGNYVIAGGDFNQAFPGTLDTFPITKSENWIPGILEESNLPDNWQFAYDSTQATCRLLDQPYCEDCQLYVIDGFILSPNVKMEDVQTIPLNFEHSDHNPVRLRINLLP